jgi:UDP-N-acetylmuramoyl-L-alanyl-D-glutamate--2,6-diaminopimelate ligase
MSATSVEVLRQELAAAGLLVGVQGTLPERVVQVTDDSRRVVAGGAFLAVRGHAADGHTYLGDAVKRGMALAVVEPSHDTSVPALVVRESREAAAVVAAAVHGHPARRLTLLAVTGTSGKTTTASMLRHLWDRPDAPAASIGTLGTLVGSEGRALPGGQGLTTPGPLELHQTLRALVDAGVRTVAMEASSHALDQRRVHGLTYAAAIFTNLTRDHLDYHGSMDAYFAAKARLVSLVASDGVVIPCADDGAWARLPAERRQVRFGLADASADVTASDLRFTPMGSHWRLVARGASAAVHLPLVGDFNVTNALGAAAASWALGHSLDDVAARLSTLPQVPGRLERILEHPVVLRDYAHKPDALERAVSAVRPFVGRRLLLVFGCGGDRDRGKRPIMGEIAERLADDVILTSDNPRTEDPERILDEIEAGMTHRRHQRIEDRRSAIAAALAVARDGDVVLLAGKGHETYQIRGTTSLPFDEATIVRDLMTGGA